MTAAAVRRRAHLFVLAAALFVVLTIAAMVVYRGGSIFDLESAHYQFFGNYFSDLGAVTTYAGRTNSIPRALFMISLTLLGIACAWSAPIWRVYAVRSEARLATTATRVMATASGLAFVAIAMVPPDTERSAHIALVQVAFVLLLGLVASLVVVQVRNDASRRLLTLNVALLAMLTAYVLVVIAGPNLDSVTGLRLQIVAQKLAVYASILNLSLQAWGATRRAGAPASAPGGRLPGPTTRDVLEGAMAK